MQEPLLLVFHLDKIEDGVIGMSAKLTPKNSWDH